jgi:hypothetical protein
MKSTYVDPKTGDVVCPVCGARNQFTVKRTAKAKWAGVPTLGIGTLALPKRLSCNGCGTNLKRGGGSAPPSAKASRSPAKASSPSSGFVSGRDRPKRPTGDAAWDTLVEFAKKLDVYETSGFGRRWLRRAEDDLTVARYDLQEASFSVKLKNHHDRQRALALEGATDEQQSFIHVPHSRRGEWEALVALAAGRNPAELKPSLEPPPDESESAIDPPTMTSELERLADLHARGALSDEQFEAAKERLLRS